MERRHGIVASRILILDSGYSSIPQLSEPLENVSWSIVAEMQQEPHLVIRAQEDCSIEIQRHFRGWSQKIVFTDCSSFVVIWDTDSWHVTPTQKDVTSYPVHRAALCMRLRRVTARRVAHEDDLFVLLTKFHKGTAQSKRPLYAHKRFLP